MVIWDRIKQQAEQILGTEFRLEKLSTGKWNRGTRQDTSTSRVIDGRFHFFLDREGADVYTASVTEPTLTASEKRLVELMLEAFRMQDRRFSTPAQSEEERKARLVRAWLLRQLEQGIVKGEIPDSLAAYIPLSNQQIPLLVYGDYSDERTASYQDLKKLLVDFFDSEMVLIPLQDKEWLILAPESLLHESSEEGEEAPEAALTSLAHALHEMLVTEWVGECHVAVDVPLHPLHALLGTVHGLREAMLLGRTYRMADNIHTPWNLQLEWLLYTVSDEQKQQFLERVLKRVDLLKDPEMMTTLEQFIALDCSVSETARKLFIHRNTLLYRLDKFKQETGLDVRTFHHAQLVHIALLLYKVTKRT